MLKKIFIVTLAMILVLGLVACGKQTQYTLAFKNGDGEELSKTIYISNKEISIPEAPKIEGKKFKGWFFNKNGEGDMLTEDYFVNKPAKKSTVVYACYEDIQYTLTFLDASGVVLSEMKVSNKTIKLPKAPENANLHFIGWYLDANATGVMLTEDYFVNKPATEDITVYACYSKNADLFNVTPSSIDGCTILGIKDTVSNVIIPEKMIIVVSGIEKEYKVEAIYANAFANNKDIVSITIPDTVKSIGDNAFSGCTNLKEIYVPASTTKVGKNIFANTTSLTDITAPTWVVGSADNEILVNVTLNAGEEIEAEMFKGAKNLATLILPSELKTIGKEAFNGAKSLESISIPKSVTKIEHDAFIYCESLTSITVDAANKNYTSNDSNCIVEVEFDEEKGNIETLIAACSTTKIYEGIENIGAYAFVGCKNLISLFIPSTVTNITEGAFLDCPSLETIKVDPRNAKYTSGDDDLKYNFILVPHEMKIIQGCKNSKIPEDIQINPTTTKKLIGISKYAFATCVDLKEIYIPTTVESLEAGSFKNCTSLEKVTIANSKIVFNGDVFEGCKGFKDITVPMHLLAGFIEKSKTVLENISLTTGEVIEDELFVGCVSLKSVTIPDSVSEIGVGAFRNCAKLVSVTISKNSTLAIINHDAFNGCTAFEMIAIAKETANVADTEEAEQKKVFVVPATVSVIGNYAFKGCAIPNLAFAENGELKRIEYKVFADCTALKSVSIPSYINSVDFDAFNGCANLTDASVPADFIRALSNAKNANGNPAVKTLEITSDSIINCYYIREMKNLSKLIISEDVETIDNRSFEGCSNLAAIEVDENNAKYVSINGCLIEKDTGTLILGTTESIIPNSVKKIASYAFALSNVSEIVIPETVECIEKFAFSSCRKLADVTIESSATVIEDLAFDGSDAITNAVIPANAILYISQASLNTVEITEGAIPAYAFKDCVPLNEVIVSTDVTSVGENAFIGCNNIIAITAPASILKGFSELKLDKLGINEFDERITKEFIDNFKDITKLYMVASENAYDNMIANDAFDSCKGIIEANVPTWIISKIHTATIKKLTVNSGNDLSGNYKFPALEEVVFGKSITSINAKIFSDSTNLSSITVEAGNAKYTVDSLCLLDGTTVVLGALGFTLPNNVTAIGDYAFAGRAGIETITLHEGIVSVGNNAFYGCGVLKVDTFPISLTTIGDYAFYGCNGLTVINLPGVTSIGEYAFAHCGEVTEITLPYAMLSVIASESSIGNNAFYGCNKVTVASIPVFAIKFMPSCLTTLNIIAGEALEASSIVGFNKLQTLNIGATVNEISPLVFVADGGENNFASSLTYIIISEENETFTTDGKCIVTKVGGKLILGSNVTEMIIPEYVTEIVENAFIGCNKITSVNVPASVTSINPLAFVGCTAIENIVVAKENTVYYSENNAILKKDNDVVTLVVGCKTTVIPENVSTIGDYAFYGVIGLTEINIPGSVVTVGDYAFANTGIVEIRLHVSVVTVGAGAFEGCSSLNKVIVLENSALETIKSSAFKGCARLNLIVIPGTIQNIAPDAIDPSVKIYWYGTQAQFESSEVKASLAGAQVFYYSASNDPQHWYYKDNGTNVAIW